MADHNYTGFCASVAVRDAGDKGLGIFAERPLTMGQLVWRFLPENFEIFDEAGFTALLDGLTREAAAYELTHCFAFEDFPEIMVRVRDAGRLINHAEDANVATNFKLAPARVPNPSKSDYLSEVKDALLEDRYALVAVRDIARGEELTNNYTRDIFDPPFYLRLCEDYGVDEDYLE